MGEADGRAGRERERESPTIRLAAQQASDAQLNRSGLIERERDSPTVRFAINGQGQGEVNGALSEREPVDQISSRTGSHVGKKNRSNIQQ